MCKTCGHARESHIFRYRMYLCCEQDMRSPGHVIEKLCPCMLYWSKRTNKSSWLFGRRDV